MAHVHVRFQPEGRNCPATPGTSLLDVARQAGIHLNAPCGGAGSCGNCRVLLVHGSSQPTPAETAHLRPEELARGMRLACQVVVNSDLTVLVPAETRLADQKILATGAGKSVKPDPAVRKHYCELPPPSLDDPRSDLDRLTLAIPSLDPDASPPAAALRSLGSTLRLADFKCTAVSIDDQLVAVEPGHTDHALFGVAFDVGTTTVVGFLTDLLTGSVIQTASRTNPQVAYGDDVVSRIHHTDQRPDGLAVLHSLILSCLDEIIRELTSASGVSPDSIYELSAVGNTTMLHLLLAVPPSPIARAPYVPAFTSPVFVPVTALNLHVNPAARLYVLPGIAGFVGADTVAVTLASSIHEEPRLRLAVDVGTNGEIVLGSSRKLLCCSTAAGPAFEGARIKFGMRAAPGAIECVDIDDDVRLRLISGDKVAGICGTGLIDAVAELLRVGIIEPTGRICSADEVPDLGPALARRIHAINGANDFVLAHPEETLHGQAVYLTQRDVREVQLAKAAIAAGISILKRELNVTDTDIEEVLLAGAFGNFIRKDRAVAIGLLPRDLLDRIRFVGNAAGVGARLALVNRSCRDQAREISRQTRYVELAARPDFQTIFTDHLLFPAIP